MIDTTVGVESVIWYQDGQSDRRRVQVTFQESLTPGSPNEPKKLHGELELFGDYKEALFGRMTLDSPDSLDELAGALLTAAQHWRHCIEECECFEGSEAPSTSGIKILSFGDLKIEDLEQIFEEEDEEPDE